MIAERATKSARSDAIDAALKAKYHRELTKCGAVNYVVRPTTTAEPTQQTSKDRLQWGGFSLLNRNSIPKDSPDHVTGAFIAG